MTQPVENPTWMIESSQIYYYCVIKMSFNLCNQLNYKNSICCKHVIPPLT